MAFGTLIHRNPIRTTAAAMRDAERAINTIHRQFASQPDLRFVAQRRISPRIDAVETETGYIVNAELPGLGAEDLDVSVEEGVLTIKGKQDTLTAEVGRDQEEGEAAATPEEVGGAVSSMRWAGGFERRIRFNGEIDEAGVSATYKDGLLTVTLPKRPEPEPVVRSIPVEAG